MNTEKELSPEINSAPQALALSDIEEGMGHNVTRAQGLQEELALRRASLLQDSAEAQALKGQEELLVEIVEEEMAHQTQVSVLSHLHLRQAEEIRAQSNEIKRLSTLLEKQQTLLEQVQESQKQHSASVAQRAQPSTSRLSELQQEAFQYLPSTVNVRCGMDIQHLSSISQNIPVAGRQHFGDELAEEATWGSNHPCYVDFAGSEEGGFTSTPLKSAAKVGEDYTLLPQQKQARQSLLTSAVSPPSYDMQMALCKFCKLHKPKINKLKGGYSATANLIFQSWLKDIRVQVEDRNLSQRKAMQLIKDFTAEHAHNEVEFYMGMVVDEQQTFEGLIQHLKNAFQSGETTSELISNFYARAQKKNESKEAFADELQILVHKIIDRKPEFRKDANEQLKGQYVHKLKDPYYAAIACSMLQSSEDSESLTQFWGHLAMTFGGRSKSGKTSSHTVAIETSLYVISEEAGEHRLLKNSRQRQRKIKQQASQISSLEAQNKKLGQLLEPKFLVETITRVVASNLNMGKPNTTESSPSGFISKPYLGRPHPSQLAPGVDSSLDPSLTCRYCKDTGHLKENCVKLTQHLAWNKQEAKTETNKNVPPKNSINKEN